MQDHKEVDLPIPIEFAQTHRFRGAEVNKICSESLPKGNGAFNGCLYNNLSRQHFDVFFTNRNVGGLILLNGARPFFNEKRYSCTTEE